MYALISRAGDSTPHLEEVAPPELNDDEVRISVAAAGFTLFDAFVAADHAPVGLPDVIGLGFDFAGTVIETGAAVTGFTVGDRVAGVHGDAAAGARAHATEVVVPARAIAGVPDGFELTEAASIPLNALTARQALDLLGSTRGDLLVTGAAGGVGTWAVALAKRDGWAVTALVKPGNEDAAREAGADTVLTDPGGAVYDVVLDAAAIGEPALAAVRDGGRYISLKPGRAPAPVRGIHVEVVLNQPDGTALAGLIDLAARGEVPVRIAGIRPLDQAATAYAEATAAPGSDGRWLLVP